MPNNPQDHTSMPQDISPWEREVQIKSVAEGTFTNASPLWDWKGRNFISATQLLAQCLRAGSQTLPVPESFLAHEIHTNFIRAGSYRASVTYKVERLSNGKEFCTRLIRAEQNGKLLLVCFISFQAVGRKQGSKIMMHSETWKTGPLSPPGDNYRDDVADIRAETGGNIEGCVLPTVDLSASPIISKTEVQVSATTSSPPRQTKRVSPSWMRIKGPVSASSEDRLVHLMGLLYVADVFVLDAAPRLSGIDIGFTTIHRDGVKPDINVMLTLSSLINIHNQDRWRCDEWFYVENECPSARENGRFLVTSNIFTQDGELIASTTQEGFSVLSPSLDKAKSSL